MLNVFLLGGFKAMTNGDGLVGFRSLRTEALMAYLSVHRGTAVMRTDLLNLLWTGYSKANAQASLRVAINNIHQVIDPNAYIVTSRYTLEIPYCYCDVLDMPPVSQAAILPGFEGVDSPPFIDWLLDIRHEYTGRVITSNFPALKADDGEKIRTALVFLASLGSEEVAHNALVSLSHLFSAYGMIDDAILAHNAANGIYRWAESNRHLLNHLLSQ
jgi:hypothetical protein